MLLNICGDWLRGFSLEVEFCRVLRVGFVCFWKVRGWSGLVGVGIVLGGFWKGLGFWCGFWFCFGFVIGFCLV